jgi:hypothetical protein
MIAEAMHQGLVFAIIVCSGLWLLRFVWRRAVNNRKPRGLQIWQAAIVGVCTLECATHAIDDWHWWFALTGFIAGIAALAMSADKRYTK